MLPQSEMEEGKESCFFREVHLVIIFYRVDMELELDTGFQERWIGKKVAGNKGVGTGMGYLGMWFEQLSSCRCGAVRFTSLPLTHFITKRHNKDQKQPGKELKKKSSLN